MQQTKNQISENHFSKHLKSPYKLLSYQYILKSTLHNTQLYIEWNKLLYKFWIAFTRFSSVKCHRTVVFGNMWNRKFEDL